jgi:hypothetical protein
MKRGARKSYASSIDLQPMKTSFAIAALILAVGACLGWRDHQELAIHRTKNTKLLAEATALGITPDPKAPREKVLGSRQRDSRPKLTSAECIAFVKEMKAEEKKSHHKKTRWELIDRYDAFRDRLSALDEGELKRLVAELRSTPELDDRSRNSAVMMALTTLATRYPQTALALLSEIPGEETPLLRRKHLAGTALGNLAKSDPVAATKWIKEQERKAPDLVDDNLKVSLLSAVASQDPKLAFQFIEDLEFKDASNSLHAIAEAAKTPEERTLTLDALRAYTSTLDDPKRRTESTDQLFSSLANEIAKEGLQNAIQWFDSAKLSSAERESFSRGLSHYWIPSGETGQWIEWIGKTLPTDQAAQQITDLADNWTEKDYEAAGTWLTQAPEGPAKQAAVRGYVQAVAAYEPETAVQWAMTLPPGKDRDATLQQIYHKWPKNEPAAKAAAEAFADQHGIKR